MRANRLLMLGVAAIVLGACSGDDGDLFTDDASAGAADYSYTIPTGAGEAYDRGEPLEILPAELSVWVGEVIELVNEDDRGHLVGPFFVGAGETLTQRFANAGEFAGVCTVHPSGQLVLVVEDP
jgi:plastocyanin